jgi:hypothetical protein
MSGNASSATIVGPDWIPPKPAPLEEAAMDWSAAIG